MFDQTITIYNKCFDMATKETIWQRTILNGASWAGCQKVRAGEGLSSADGYSVRIPLKAFKSGYLSANAFAALADKMGAWTVQNGDIVVHGEAPEVTGGITQITKAYYDSFTVTAVHSDNLMRPLPHLRVEGR